jgi:hypothetical protein
MRATTRQPDQGAEHAAALLLFASLLVTLPYAAPSTTCATFTAVQCPIVATSAWYCVNNRLDAIGAIGIARCFTFGGAFKRVLHDPSVPPRVNLTKEQYMQQGHQATTFNNFAEKLLKIKVTLTFLRSWRIVRELSCHATASDASLACCLSRAPLQRHCSKALTPVR